MGRVRRRRVDGRIEIAGEHCVCTVNGRRTAPTSVAEFLHMVAPHLDPLPVRDAIPESVRAVRRRGDDLVLALEEPPQVRSVRWLREDSPEPFGPGALYRQAVLAFPFVILAVALRDGALTDVQQCFYRTARLRTLDEPSTLGIPVLPNVTRHRRLDLPCWLCLGKRDLGLRRLHSLDERVAAIRAAFWSTAFNGSCGDTSHWETMRDVDPRLASLARWETETRRDPLFPLTVRWRPVPRPLAWMMDEMLDAIALSPPPRSAGDLIGLLRCPEEEPV